MTQPKLAPLRAVLADADHAPLIDQHRGRDTEGHHVREAVVLLAEGTLGARPARHAAVEAIEHHGDEDRAARQREVAVDGRDDGIEAGEQAARWSAGWAANRRRGSADFAGLSSRLGLGRHGRHHRRIPHLIHSRAPMRWSQYPVNTTKETPADAEVVSHQLMLRAGLIRKLAAGLYTWMPLGLRAMRKVENIVREEMNRAGALELLMPGVIPAELWVESGRWERVRPRAAAPQGPARARLLPGAHARGSHHRHRAQRAARATASCR